MDVWGRIDESIFWNAGIYRDGGMAFWNGGRRVMFWNYIGRPGRVVASVVLSGRGF